MCTSFLGLLPSAYLLLSQQPLGDALSCESQTHLCQTINRSHSTPRLIIVRILKPGRRLTVPEAAQWCESVVAAFVTLVVPVMMVGHLRIMIMLVLTIMVVMNMVFVLTKWMISWSNKTWANGSHLCKEWTMLNEQLTWNWIAKYTQNIKKDQHIWLQFWKLPQNAFQEIHRCEELSTAKTYHDQEGSTPGPFWDKFWADHL